jgi:prepilin-type N-terminal cleavage/methylation domain-containing protein
MKEKGFTLIEIVVVLGVIAVLSAILFPIVTSHLGEAKITRAKKDTNNIAAAIIKFEESVGKWPRWVDGTKTKDADARFIVLYSKDGKKAEEGTGVAGVANWNKGANDNADPTYSGVGGVPANNDGDTLDHHLSENAPGGTADAAKQYKKWKGPYLSVPKADPWGNKYYANVQFLAGQPGDAAAGDKGKHSFVISAGADGVINTAFDQDASKKLDVGGDDIVAEIK